MIIYLNIWKYIVINFQKLYDLAKRNCAEGLHLSKKMQEDEAFVQSQNCLKVLEETMNSNKWRKNEIEIDY